MRVLTPLLSIFSILASIVMAHAGEFANREILGFSTDGGLFAFEEFGVQDGSGFPYANLYVIDTATDQWTAGSPFRVLLEDETKTVFDAREEIVVLAGTVLKSFEDRGEVVATNEPTERTGDKKRMAAEPRRFNPPLQETIEFRVEPIALPAPANCADTRQYFGFRLLQIATQPGESTRILHEDTDIPESRLCPLDYDLANIVTYFPQTGDPATPVAAILVLVTKVGFEGPSGRYLAVTTQLPNP